MAAAAQVCPRCGSPARPLLYGLFHDPRAATEDGWVVAGSCTIDDSAPAFACVACAHQWGRLGDYSDTSSSAIMAPPQRSVEIELDVLVAHELASRGPASAVLWQAGGYDPPAARIVVSRQEQRDDGRTTDVVARAEGNKTLYCESKAIGGQFEHGQWESYAEHAMRNGGRPLLVAPRLFLEAAGGGWKGKFVYVEQLEQALNDAVVQVGANDELGRSYAWRAEAFHRFTTSPGYTLVPDPPTIIFADRYRDLVRRLAGNAVEVSPTSLQGKGAGFAHYILHLPTVSLIHKLGDGRLDLAANRWTLHRLRSWAGDLVKAESPPPDGWEITLQERARVGTFTGEKVPVMRWTVPAVDRAQDWSADVEADLTIAIRRAADIVCWLLAGAGAVLATGGGRPAVDAELRRAQSIARLVGDNRSNAITSLIDAP